MGGLRTVLRSLGRSAWWLGSCVVILASGVLFAASLASANLGAVIFSGVVALGALCVVPPVYRLACTVIPALEGSRLPVILILLCAGALLIFVRLEGEHGSPRTPPEPTSPAPEVLRTIESPPAGSVRELCVDNSALSARYLAVRLQYVDARGAAYWERLRYDTVQKKLVAVSAERPGEGVFTREGAGHVAEAGFSIESGDFTGATTVSWRTSYISRVSAESTDIRFYLLAPDVRGEEAGHLVVIATIRLDFGQPRMMIGVGRWKVVSRGGQDGT